MEIKQIKISELKSAEYNPREMTETQHKDLKDSIKKFGMVDPIIVNKHEGRENIIIGGHQRLRICEEMGMEEVPVFYVDLDIEKEKELNIRLNKNTGQWDFDKLANEFDDDDLLEWGFGRDEIFGFGGIDDEFIEDIKDVITVEPPESVVLKLRSSFHCEDMKSFDKIKEFFGGENKLDVDKLIKLINKNG